jgi:hypothetical protein
MTFTFKLEQADGTPAEPPTIRTAVPNMRPGDTIPDPARPDAARRRNRRLGRRRAIRPGRRGHGRKSVWRRGLTFRRFVWGRVVAAPGRSARRPARLPKPAGERLGKDQNDDEHDDHDHHPARERHQPDYLTA